MNYYLVDGNWYGSDELYHHGTKGMKWGVRRYQNPDGTLTAYGRKRAENDAKRIANAKARDNDRLAKLGRSVDAKSSKKVNKLINKVSSRYAGTKLSDIKVMETVRNGRKYTQVLMGYVGPSPYDGSPRYAVTAGTWTKSSNWVEKPDD